MGDRVLALAQKVQVKPYLRKTKSGITPVKGHVRFLGHDSSGNEINIGSHVRINAGPDKGNSGTVTGQAKGGAIAIEVGSGMQKRKVLADPDEIRVTR